MTQAQRVDAPAETKLRDKRVVTIRPIVESDHAGLLAFGQALPGDESLYLEEDFQNPDIISRLTNAAAAEHWRQFVAEGEDGTIVGYTSVRRLPGWSSHVADIYLVVSEDWRRTGLGSALAQTIFNATREMGADKVIVQMLAEQGDGQDIFTHLGFTIEGRLSKHALDRSGRLHDLLILSYQVK